MLEKIKTEEMSQKDIKESLRLFYAYLSKNNIEFDRADPLSENAYCSGSDIAGVYFPNTIFKSKRLYEIRALAKVGGELGIVKELDDEKAEKIKIRDLPPYQFESFDELLNSQQFRQARDEIKSRIDLRRHELAALESIETQTKKDGQPFADILKNFKSSRADVRIAKSDYDSFKIYFYGSHYQELTIYRETENRAEPMTAAELAEMIKNAIANKKETIADYESELKTLPARFAKLEKMAAEYKKIAGDGVARYIFENSFKSLLR